MGTLKFGLLGCSAIAIKHAKALQGVPGAELAAVCDIDNKRANLLSCTFGVPCYGSLKEMTRKTDLDVISVLTPSLLHARHGIQAANVGKHVVIEKPLALSLEEADEVIEACQRNGVRLFVAHQYRYKEPVRRLSTAQAAGRFGRMVLGTVRLRWHRNGSYYAAAAWRGKTREGGGLLFNQAVHFVDALQWIMGDVVSVKAEVATSAFGIEAEDTAVAILRFKNEALGIVEATTAIGPTNLEGSISVLGEEGSVVISGYSMDRLQTWSFRNASLEDEGVWEMDRRGAVEPLELGHRRLLEDVVSAICHGTDTLVSGAEGRRCLRLILGMHEAASTGREIVLQP